MTVLLNEIPFVTSGVPVLDRRADRCDYISPIRRKYSGEKKRGRLLAPVDKNELFRVIFSQVSLQPVFSQQASYSLRLFWLATSLLLLQPLHFRPCLLPWVDRVLRSSRSRVVRSMLPDVSSTGLFGGRRCWGAVRLFQQLCPVPGWQSSGFLWNQLLRIPC